MVLAEKIRGAQSRTRTGDLILTKDVLYRLSYMGICNKKAGDGIRTRDPQLGRLML